MGGEEGGQMGIGQKKKTARLKDIKETNKSEKK